MSNIFWTQFPAMPRLHCIALKDRIQDQIRKETRNATPEGIVTYFHEASCRFRQENDHAYPESVSPLMSVRETDPQQKQ